jgi:hypothetical protein
VDPVEDAIAAEDLYLGEQNLGEGDRFFMSVDGEGPGDRPSLSESSPARIAQDLIDTLIIPAVTTRLVPIVRVAPYPEQTVVALREYSRPHTEPVTKKSSTPVVLRILVVMLSIAFLIGFGALVAIHTQPKWFLGLRNMVAVAKTQPVSSSRMVLLTSSSKAVTYGVPTDTYTIVITIDHPCWIVVLSPTNTAKPLVAKTFEPSASPISIPIHGSASVTISARVLSFSIMAHSNVIGSVKSPHLYVDYSFVPQGT